MPDVLIDGSLYTFAPSGGAYHFLNELLARLPSQSGLNFRLITVAKETLATQMAGSIPTFAPPFSFRRWIPDGLVKEALRPLKPKLDALFLKRTSTRGKTLFHSIAYTPSPDPKIPMVSMVHDLIAEKFPQYYEPGVAESFRTAKERVIGHSIRYIAVSEKTKNDLVDVYGISPKQIDVIYHGINRNTFHPNLDETLFQQVQPHIPGPYFLYVGGRLNHKNFRGLLEGFAQKNIAKDFFLVAAGFPWDEEELSLLKQWNLRDRVILIPSPSSDLLAELYRRSTAFVFPSFYEGFGIPLVEAMACGAPVLASFTGPFPEIANEAALYFDPTDPSDISNKLMSATDSSVREKLKEKGFDRAKEFSWEKAVAQTMESYQKTFLSIGGKT